MMQQMFLGQGPDNSYEIGDVFSVDLYTGNNSTRSINNGIDLSGEGGLVWIKHRSPTNTYRNHNIWDTKRGVQKAIRPNLSNAQNTAASGTQSLYQFNSNGFSLGANYTGENETNHTYAAWTFRQAQKFFSVTTYTGNGATRSIPHGLGSQPGLVIIKNYSGTGNWIVWHKEQYESSTPGTYRYFMFNSSAAANYGVLTGVDSTNVGVINNSTVNGSGYNYVMYSFAADTDNLIKTGLYTGDASTSNAVTVGFEPQFLMIKSASASGDWRIFDTTRGTSGTGSKILFPNSNTWEQDTAGSYMGIQPTSTGFTITATGGDFNGNNTQYAYMAIAAP